MPTQPIRVAHLMQYFLIGGLERMVERLCVAAKSRGVESLVIGYLEDGPVRESLEEHGIRTVMLDPGAGLRPELAWRLPVSYTHLTLPTIPRWCSCRWWPGE